MSLKDDYVADMNARLKLQENKTEGTFGQDIIGAVGKDVCHTHRFHNRYVLTT